jgi:hypothetical protein
VLLHLKTGLPWRDHWGNNKKIKAQESNFKSRCFNKMVLASFFVLLALNGCQNRQVSIPSINQTSKWATSKQQYIASEANNNNNNSERTTLNQNDG